MASSRKKEKQASNTLWNWYQGKPEYVCAGDQCVIKAPSINNLTITDIFSAEYYEAMVQAAKFGFLYTLLTTTPNELFNRHFMKENFSANQIFYARQCINAITMLSLSSLLGLTDIKSLFLSVGTPAASAGLKYSGYSETASQLIPAGVVVATQLATDVSHSARTLLTLLSGVGGGILGNKVVNTGYRMMSDLFYYAKSKVILPTHTVDIITTPRH